MFKVKVILMGIVVFGLSTSHAIERLGEIKGRLISANIINLNLDTNSATCGYEVIQLSSKELQKEMKNLGLAISPEYRPLPRLNFFVEDKNGKKTFIYKMTGTDDMFQSYIVSECEKTKYSCQDINIYEEKSGYLFDRKEVPLVKTKLVTKEFAALNDNGDSEERIGIKTIIFSIDALNLKELWKGYQNREKVVCEFDKVVDWK